MQTDQTSLVTDEQVHFFQKTGYLHYGSILGTEELKCVQSEMQCLLEMKNPNFFRGELARTDPDPRNPGAEPYTPGPEDAPDVPYGQEKFVQILGLWRVSDVIRNVTLNPKLGRLAAGLLGVKRVRLLADMALVKPGNISAPPTHWHQDYPDHPTSLPDVTAWIALDDTTLENGCMRYIPGSLKWGELLNYDYEEGAGAVKAGVDTSNAVAVEMKAGEVTFHHSLTVHSAGANTTDRARRAYIVRYMPEQTVYRVRKEERDSEAKEGQPFPDEQHPIIGGG